MNVAVLGASTNPDRYSNQAVALLKEKGHTVFPVNPAASEVCGLKVYPDLAAISEQVDTITVYLSPARSAALVDDLVAAEARRVILNPGAESPALTKALQNSGTEVLEACTLVLLHTGQF